MSAPTTPPTDAGPSGHDPARLGRAALAWALAALPLARQLELQHVPTAARAALVLGLAGATAGLCGDLATTRRVARGAGVVGAAYVAARWGWSPLGPGGVAVLAATLVVAIAGEIVDGRLGDGEGERSERVPARALSAAPAVLAATAAVAAAGGWLTVRNFVPVAAAAWAVAVAATGAAGVGGAVRRAGRASVLLVPLVAADVLIATRTGLVVPAAVIALGSIGVAALVLRPAWWAPIEEAAAPLIDPVDRLLGRLDRSAAWAVRPLRTLAHHSWRVLRRVFGVIGHVLSVVGLTVAWVAVVALPWAVQRLIRWDPLAAPAEAGSRWVPLVAAPSRAERTWAPDLADPDRRRVVGRRRMLSVGGAVAVVALVWFALPERGTGDTTTAALDRLDQARVSDATRDLLAQADVRLFAGTELPDFDSEFLHVAGGVRRSWEPPLGRCDRRIRAWLFGGSTAFGISQADGRTIASALARQAWADDIPLVIENRSVPGDVSWQEHARLQRALAASDDPPDLVIFYDGFNDFLAQDLATGFDDGGTGTFRALIDDDLMPLLSHVEQRTSRGRVTYTASLDRPGQTRSDYSVSVPATLFQYTQAQAWSRAALEARGIPMVRFFQPSQYTAGRRPGDDNDEWNPTAVQAVADLRAGLPDDVVDIADSLDAVPGDIFLDAVHTVDTVNPVIARAMLRTLRPQLEDVPGSKDPSCS